jgi:hypothetical protein
MKKLLGIIVLGLLLSGCFNKKETALENCADDRYQNFSEDSMTSVFYDRKNTKIINVTKSLESARIKQNEATDKHGAFVKKNYFYENAFMRYIYDREYTSLEERQNYENSLDLKKNELIKKSTFWYGEVGYLHKTLKELKYFSAISMFMEAPLKRKINVNEYYIRFTECEKERAEAPDAFVLRWKD